MVNLLSAWTAGRPPRVAVRVALGILRRARRLHSVQPPAAARSTGRRGGHLCCALLTGLLVGCTAPPPPRAAQPPVEPVDPVVAEVDGTALTKSEFERSWRAAHKSPMETASPGQRAAYLLKMVEQALFLQAAKKESLEVTDREVQQAEHALRATYTDSQFFTKLDGMGLTLEEWRQDLRQDLLVRKLIERRISRQVKVEKADVEAYYRANQQRFRRAPRVKLQQIVTESKAEAYRLRTQLARGADFARLARASSVAPEAKNGGVAGWFSPGQLPEKLDKVAFALRRGQVSDVVQTPYGFHVLRIIEQENAANLKFSEVQEMIQQKLFQEQQALLFQQYAQQLWRNSTVRTYLDRLLVQGSNPALPSS